MSDLVLYFQDVPDNKPNDVGRQIEINSIFVLQYIAATLLYFSCQKEPLHDKRNQIGPSEKQIEVEAECLCKMSCEQGMRGTLTATSWTVESRRQPYRAFGQPWGLAGVYGDEDNDTQ